MKRLILVLIFLLCTTHALAQDCTIAAWGDPGGTYNWISPSPFPGETFSVYVVLFAENTVAAAAYSITLPGLGNTLFLVSRHSGPGGNGLVIDEPTGTNVALGECVVGFGGLPVLVDEYVLLNFPEFTGGLVPVGPNLNQGPTPLYVTCNDLIQECEVGPTAVITHPPFPNEARSFGAVKSLFR
jgi:hypothetical protein